MKNNIRSLCWLTPSLLVFLFYIFQKVVDSLIWGDFFQTGAAFESTFKLVLWFGLVILCVLGVLAFKLVQLIYFIAKKRSMNVKRCFVEVMLILFLPILGGFIASCRDSAPLQTLKTSFMKEDINLKPVKEWLNSLDIHEIDLSMRIFPEDDYLPPNVKEEFSGLNWDVISLRVSQNDNIYLEIPFHSPVMSVVVVVGIDSKQIEFQMDEEDGVIDLEENAFIWFS